MAPEVISIAARRLAERIWLRWVWAVESETLRPAMAERLATVATGVDLRAKRLTTSRDHTH